MAIVVLVSLCAWCVGCAGTYPARVGNGPQSMKHRSVAEKFAEFAKQGWTVTSKELDAKKPKALAGSNGVFLDKNPYANKKMNPLNNAVWSTNFQVDDRKAERMNGLNIVSGDSHKAVNMVKSDGRGALNVVNPNGTGKQAVNVVGPAGMGANGNLVQKGKGGLEVRGPAGTGSANVQTNNGLPTQGTVNVMGPDGTVHTVRRDLGTDKLFAPVLSH
jgi:hypothetical protein